MNEVTHLFKTEAAGTCAEVLDFWLYECSLDEAPDAAQVAAWRDVFQARGGAFAGSGSANGVDGDSYQDMFTWADSIFSDSYI